MSALVVLLCFLCSRKCVRHKCRVDNVGHRSPLQTALRLLPTARHKNCAPRVACFKRRSVHTHVRPHPVLRSSFLSKFSVRSVTRIHRTVRKRFRGDRRRGQRHCWRCCAVLSGKYMESFRLGVCFWSGWLARRGAPRRC